MSNEEAELHIEAKTFARQLVSEIKLHNEAAVEEGLKNGYIYDRLREDIERARRMYNERVGPQIRETSNYLYTEMVRILCEGNESLLGL